MIKTKNTPIIKNSLNSYLRAVNSIHSLTKEEEFMLAKNYLEKNDLVAAHKLVTSHLKLVVKIAITYKNYGLPISELISEGSIGLMQAVKKFDYSLGFRLSTYAMWWIKASIQEYILKSWSLVKIGTTSAQKKLFFSLRKAKNKLLNDYKYNINETDYHIIANKLGASSKEVSEMDQRLSYQDLSLNNPANKNDNNHNEIINLLPTLQPNQESILLRKQAFNSKMLVLTEALKTLDERETTIITARKLNESPSTLDTLSMKYKISKERVRQIENKAFRKIKDFVLTRVNEDGQRITSI